MAWIESKKIMSNNINHYLHLKGKTRKEACCEMKIGYSTFTEWANGRKYPRIDKIELMANYFGCQKSDLIEDKTRTEVLNKNDEVDIAKRLMDIISDLESKQSRLIFQGEPMTEVDIELIKVSLENILRIAKIKVKE